MMVMMMVMVLVMVMVMVTVMVMVPAYGLTLVTESIGIWLLIESR